MAATSKPRKTFGDFTENPLLGVLIYTVVPGVVGTVLGYLDPSRNALLWGLIPAAVGLAIGCYSQFSDDPIAEFLRLPARGMLFVLYVIGHAF